MATHDNPALALVEARHIDAFTDAVRSVNTNVALLARLTRESIEIQRESIEVQTALRGDIQKLAELLTQHDAAESDKIDE